MQYMTGLAQMSEEMRAPEDAESAKVEQADLGSPGLFIFNIYMIYVR